MDLLDSFLSYYNCELDIQAFFGAFYSDGCISRPGPGANGRFQFSQGFGNRAGRAYFDLVFFPMMAMLAPRFRAKLFPDISNAVKGDKTYTSWVLHSRRSSYWSVLYHLTYVDGVKVLPQWLADSFNEVFIAYFAMGDGSWQYTSGMLFCTNSFHPECLTVLQSVFLRHGITTVVQELELMSDGRMARVLFIRKGDTASLLRMQDIARRHFCPEMMYRAGLNPDGTPFPK
jgi:hypothetical protein